MISHTKLFIFSLSHKKKNLLKKKFHLDYSLITSFLISSPILNVYLLKLNSLDEHIILSLNRFGV